MKTYFSFLLMAGLALTTLSCERTREVIVGDGTPAVDNDTFSQVLETTGTFTLDANGELSFGEQFTKALFDADQVLVYRLVSDQGGVDVWQPIPRTVYIANGSAAPYELDYDFDFSKFDIMFYAGGTFDKNNVPAVVKPWLQSQTFRVVLLPGYFPGQAKSNVKDVSRLKLMGYDEVIRLYNIDDSKVFKF